MLAPLPGPLVATVSAPYKEPHDDLTINSSIFLPVPGMGAVAGV